MQQHCGQVGNPHLPSSQESAQIPLSTWPATRLLPYSGAGRRAKHTGISRRSSTNFPTCSWPVC